MSDVQVILREDVANLGDAGALVRVKPGYARNFLVPQGKAELATEAKVAQLEHQRRVIAEKLSRELDDVRAVADRYRGMVIEVEANAGAEGKLFGSVTAAQIAGLLAQQGLEIDRRKIGLSEPIRSVGDHSVSVRLHRDLQVDVTVRVHGTAAPQEPELRADEPRDADESLRSADGGGDAAASVDEDSEASDSSDESPSDESLSDESPSDKSE